MIQKVTTHNPSREYNPATHNEEAWLTTEVTYSTRVKVCEGSGILQTEVAPFPTETQYQEAHKQSLQAIADHTRAESINKLMSGLREEYGPQSWPSSVCTDAQIIADLKEIIEQITAGAYSPDLINALIKKLGGLDA